MQAVAEQQWNAAGASAPAEGTPDREELGSALLQAAVDVAEYDADVRPDVLERAWTLAEHLAHPIEFLVIGDSGEARDAVRFLGGMSEEIDADLASVVACLRVGYGAKEGPVATSGEGAAIQIPSDPILLAPHAPVTLTYMTKSPVLKSMRFTHLRNLGAGFADEAIETEVARADAVIWLTDAAEAWSQNEQSLLEALPKRLVRNTILVLSGAHRVTARPELQDTFDAKVDTLSPHFATMLPMALDAALVAAPGGAVADAALFNASGAPALLSTLRKRQSWVRKAKDTEAGLLLEKLSEARDAARADIEASEAAKRAESEEKARTEAAQTPRPAPAPVADAPEPPIYPRPDETALAILREEAEREAAARRSDGDGVFSEIIETPAATEEVAAPVEDAATAPETPEVEAPTAPAADHAPDEEPSSTAPDGDSPDTGTILGFLAASAAEQADRRFDASNDDDRREAFDWLLAVAAGLGTRMRDGTEALPDGERLMNDMEEAEDMIMLLSCEGDAAALAEAADVITQLIGDYCDRSMGIVSE